MAIKIDPHSVDVACPKCSTKLSAKVTVGLCHLQCIDCKRTFFIDVEKRKWADKKVDQSTYSVKIHQTQPPPIQAARVIRDAPVVDAELPPEVSPQQDEPELIQTVIADHSPVYASHARNAEREPPGPVMVFCLIFGGCFFFALVTARYLYRGTYLSERHQALQDSYVVADEPKVEKPFRDIAEIPEGPGAVTILLKNPASLNLETVCLDLCDTIGATGYRLQRNPQRNHVIIRVRYDGRLVYLVDQINFGAVVSVDEENRFVRVNNGVSSAIVQESQPDDVFPDE